jgi:transposase
MAEPMKPPVGPDGIPQIQIDIDDATAQGAYCNLVLLNHNDNEFVLDFAYVQPTTARARVRARILSSPRHAKRLLRALELNVRRYEERFGRIEEPEGPPAPSGTLS